MTIAEYIVECLYNNRVTKAFGVPGGVILDLINALHKKFPAVEPILSYHEQAAGFAALGYAQAKKTLGCAYATRGPGFTNLITAIADAYHDSIPALFITAHSKQYKSHKCRVFTEQEIDPRLLVSSITKKVIVIDDLNFATCHIDNAFKIALKERQGPVVLDVKSALFSREISDNIENLQFSNHAITSYQDDELYRADLQQILLQSKRPLILLGDGARGNESYLLSFAEKYSIPVVSSRGSLDLCSSSPMYFGYTGSHGIRYCNYLLYKCDALLVFGNRLAFPQESPSFSQILKKIMVYWIDIDKAELDRFPIANAIKHNIAVENVVHCLSKIDIKRNYKQWFMECKNIRKYFNSCDVGNTCSILKSILSKLQPGAIICSDVGNNEFWLSRAAVYLNYTGRIIFSKSFSPLGCSLPKAIGAAMSDMSNFVCCVTGDQGLQFNVQELQIISQYRLPIALVVLNNQESAMIKDHQLRRNFEPVHVDSSCSYKSIDLEKLASLYDLNYKLVLEEVKTDLFCQKNLPMIIEVKISVYEKLIPNLPFGKSCIEQTPIIEYKS